MSYDDLATLLIGLALLCAILAGIFFVIFGEVTVRKLRKAPETKDLLGMEFVSGWDIMNVAHALSWPKAILRRLGKGPLSFLRADPDLIYQHTTKLDRFLGRAFYLMQVLSVMWLVLLAILDSRHG
jgi:hypothetical protein